MDHLPTPKEMHITKCWKQKPLQKWWSPKLIVDDLQRCHEFPTEFPDLQLQIPHLKNRVQPEAPGHLAIPCRRPYTFGALLLSWAITYPCWMNMGVSCDRMWQKKRQHKIKSNLFGKGESVKRKNTKQKKTPSCRGEFSAIQTNKTQWLQVM